MQGKGFLCMTKQTVTDVANNMSTETSYSYHLSKYFPQLTSSVNKAGSTTLTTVSNTWTYSTPVTGVVFPYISSSTQSNSITGHSVTQTFTHDSYGNPTQLVKSFNNGVTETTTNVFTNDGTNWLLGKLTSTTVQYAKSGETTINNIIGFTYSSDGILKPDLIKYYEGTTYYYYKNHDYNSNGNLTQIYEYGTNIGSRQTNYTYETNGVRTKTVTDIHGHETEYFYDSYGRLSSEQDYLDNTTSYGYDNMGRSTTVSQADGLVATTSYGWGLTGGPTYAVSYIQKSGNEGSLTKNWYDELGREIRSDVKGFNGANIYTVTEYNTKGQVYRVSEPSTTTSPSQWNTNTYDTYGRISGITRPSGRNTTYTYGSGTSRITETTGGITSWKETDSQGLLTIAHDNGGDIIYSYFPDGKMKSITAPGNAVTTFEYNDTPRNQTKLIDPSAGTIEYTYDAFGRLKTQKNALNQTTTYNYYADGRISTIVHPSGEGTDLYSYNTNKQLTNISNSTTMIARTDGYDSKGRINSILESIVGSYFSTTFTYDTKGRISTRTHPSGIVETNTYNANGYLSTITATGGPGANWMITNRNERQQITGAVYNNGLITSFGYDSYGYPSSSSAQYSGTSKQDYRYVFTSSTGNLYSRQNYLKSKTETFAYDNLNRLTGVSGPENITMQYNANGNIQRKSDLAPGLFTYNHPTKPYVVTEINSSNSAISSLAQNITYTSFDQPLLITESPYQATFTYNDEGQRAKMEVKQSGSTILTRWYAGSRYSKETAGATTKEYTWIGGDAYTAPLVAVKQSGTYTYYYLLRDYLGNITHQLDMSNNVVAEYNFDAWGRRRDKDTWSYTLNGEPDLLAGRGFTSHEWLPWFNLYNMNGRLYDPIVGRFLSADNYVQAPGFTQSFNRYSYCLNNPLKYTDPSGFMTYKEYMDATYGEGNYDYRGQPAGTWGGGGSGSSGGSFGGGGGGYGGPGYGQNGTGLNGVYYDWYSSTYRSTNPGNYEVGWNYASNVASQYGDPVSAIIFSGTSSNPYQTFRGVHYADGSTWYVGEGYSAGTRGGNIPDWIGWTNNAATATAYGAAITGGSAGMLSNGAIRYYSNAWRGNQYIKTFNLSKLGTRIGYGTTGVGIIYGSINFAMSDQSWGDYGQLGVSLLSSVLTLGVYTAPIGIGVGLIDVAGGFNGFYNYLDTQQQFYNSMGGVMVPANGIPYYIQLRK